MEDPGSYPVPDRVDSYLPLSRECTSSSSIPELNLVDVLHISILVGTVIRRGALHSGFRLYKMNRSFRCSVEAIKSKVSRFTAA